MLFRSQEHLFRPLPQYLCRDECSFDRSHYLVFTQCSRLRYRSLSTRSLIVLLGREARQLRRRSMRPCPRVSTSPSSWISLISHLSHPLPFFVTVAVDQQDPHHPGSPSLCCIPPFSRSNSCSETTHPRLIFSLASQYVLIPPPSPSSSRLCHQQVAACVQF